MTRQISPAQAVVIIGGMYAAYSDWIECEIDEAVRMSKSIVAAIPWGQQRVPQNIPGVRVGWNRKSVIDAVRTVTARG